MLEFTPVRLSSCNFKRLVGEIFEYLIDSQFGRSIVYIYALSNDNNINLHEISIQHILLEQVFFFTCTLIWLYNYLGFFQKLHVIACQTCEYVYIKANNKYAIKIARYLYGEK